MMEVLLAHSSEEVLNYTQFVTAVDCNIFPGELFSVPLCINFKLGSRQFHLESW